MLDEPTNDLDIETLELLETLLQEYSGTLLLVSHDRTFLNNVVTQVYAFEGEGVVREYAGGYDDWLAQRAAYPNSKAAKQIAAASPVSSETKPAAARKTRLGFKEVRELEQLPQQIEALEIEQRDINARLADPRLYSSGAPEEAQRLGSRLQEVEAQLAQAFMRWEILEAKRTVL